MQAVSSQSMISISGESFQCSSPQQLATKCDILIENYLPGKLDKLGLGYDKLKASVPSLIYCSITGYGPGGPYDQRPGYDVMVSGVGGLMYITGPEVPLYCS